MGDSNLPPKKFCFYLKAGKMNQNLTENSQNIHDMWINSLEIAENGVKSTPKRVIQEIMHDIAPKHDFSKQVELHEKIRNDEDYDDWDYGTEPVYGLSWK